MKKKIMLFGGTIGILSSLIMSLILIIGMSSIRDYKNIAASTEGGYATLSFVGVGCTISLCLALVFFAFILINLKKTQDVSSKTISFIILASIASFISIIFMSAGSHILLMIIPFLSHMAYIKISIIITMILSSASVIEIVCGILSKEKQKQ